MRVLVVEDEPYLAEAIRDGLRLEAIAADGDTALGLLSVNAHDIAGPARCCARNVAAGKVRRLTLTNSQLPSSAQCFVLIPRVPLRTRRPWVGR